jgi:excisionase family DNA binding protein
MTIGARDAIKDGRLLLTVPEAARALGIGTTLAYQLVGNGKLPHIRLGRALRVPRASLEAWIAANTRGMGTSPRTRW